MLKKLLLADDSLTIQKVVGIVFANLDYQLLIADNGDDALALARKEFPDLVITDIGMPGRDGFELCRDIKNDANLGSVPVLLLPGAFENFDESKATAAGADGWITKPFESQALINKVEELLASASENPTHGSAPEPTGMGESVSFDLPAPVAFEEPVSFETPEFVESETLELEDPVDFEASETSVVEESISFEDPVLDEPVVDGDDIWDAVTFEEEDLQPEVAVSRVVEQVSEELVQLEEPEPVIEEAAPVIEEAAPVIEEAAPVIEEAAPVFEEESDDEILELGDEDILELEDEAIIDEGSVDLIEYAADEVAVDEEEVAIVDFSAPSPVIEVESEPVVEPKPAPVVELEQAADEVEVYDFSDEAVAAQINSGSVAPEVLEHPVTTVDVADVEERLSALTESELQEVVQRVAGPMIEKLAAQLLEQVVWEVVPDLAESMIKDEIRKIKEGAA